MEVLKPYTYLVYVISNTSEFSPCLIILQKGKKKWGKLEFGLKGKGLIFHFIKMYLSSL